MVLSDTDIRALMKSGDLVIDPPPGKIDPASVDLRVGEEGWGKQEGNWFIRKFRSRRPKRIDIKQSKIIRFPRGSITAFSTLETIKLSKKISGMYGLRSRHAREVRRQLSTLDSKISNLSKETAELKSELRRLIDKIETEKVPEKKGRPK